MSARRRVRLLLAGAAALLLVTIAGWAAHRHALLPAAIEWRGRQMAHKLGLGRALAAFGTLGAAVVPAAAAVGPAPPTQIAINLAAPDFYWQGRRFANLLLGGRWNVQPAGNGRGEPVKDVDRDGNILHLPTGKVTWPLTTVGTGPRGVTIRCRFEGKGALSVEGPVSALSSKRGLLEFTLTNQWERRRNLLLMVAAFDATDPIRNVDCREASMPAGVRFDPAFIQSLKGYKVLRFMQWERVIYNLPVTWETRHTPSTLDVIDADGVALEDIVEVGRQSGADIWLCMSWNGDDDYYRRAARLVHDTLPAGQKVYIELSNEVWNGQFGPMHQAVQESVGVPHSDYTGAAMAGYAAKMIRLMDIWAAAFADNPARLVRVAATQNGYSRTADLVLGYKDAAAHVDALATAPYFGNDVMKEGDTTDVDTIFARLAGRVDIAIDRALENRAIAQKYGKRYIAYEAGQHVVPKGFDEAMQHRIQTDPRMHTLYKRYIDGWRARVGDVLAFYQDVGTPWGLVEHYDQPLADAPKLRAVREAMDR